MESQCCKILDLKWNISGVKQYKSHNRQQVTHIFLTQYERNGMREHARCPKSSQRPLERALGEGPRGQHSFCLCAFFPLTFSVLHTPSFALLCYTSCYFYLIRFFSSSFLPHCALNPNFSSLTLCFSPLSLCFSLFSWVLMTISLQLSCKITDYREREALHSQRIQIYPTYSAVMPGNEAKFFLSYHQFTKRRSTANAEYTCGSKPAKADFPHFLCGHRSFFVNLPQSDLYPRC